MWLKKHDFFRIHDRLDAVDKDLYELSLKFQDLIKETPMDLECGKCGAKLNYKGTGFRRYAADPCPACAKQEWREGFRAALKMAIQKVKPTGGSEEEGAP